MAGIRDSALALLSGPKRDRFLAALVGAIALAGRGEYTEAGNSEAHALAALRAINETVIVIGKQLRSSVAGRSAYPDEAFIQVLTENAAMGHVESVLQWAIREAVGVEGGSDAK